MKLHFSPASPFVRKVRAAAIEVGLADRIELVPATVAPTSANRDFAALNPLRKIPALETDDGLVLYDSIVIAAYLANLAGDTRLFGEGAARWPILTRHALADGMLDCALLVRYETVLRPSELRWDKWVDDQMDKIEAGLAAFEADIADPEIAPDIATLTLAILLGYLDFRFPEHGWRSRYPRLSAWYHVVRARPSLAGTKPADQQP